MDWGTIWDFVTMIAVGAGGVALVYFRQAAQTATDEAIKEAAARINFPQHLARDLATLRGTERQEHRYECYSDLWGKLRSLAIYDEAPFDKAAAKTLSTELSDWYFSRTGGMLLSTQARDFYFALQDLLQTTARASGDWTSERSAGSGGEFEKTVLKVLARVGTKKARAAIAARTLLKTCDPASWEHSAPEIAVAWRGGIADIAGRWSDLGEAERFAVLQQAASVLRTCLANDLESRAR